MKQWLLETSRNQDYARVGPETLWLLDILIKFETCRDCATTVIMLHSEMI